MYSKAKNSRFLAEVPPEHKNEFERVMGSAPFAVIGQVTGTESLEIEGLKGKKAQVSLAELKEAWQKPLRW